jgi:GNAT superfamily N-acetyltransferase
MPETVQVAPVSSKRDLDAFIKFPWKIYRGDPNWVPPLLVEQKGILDTKKNPFFLHSEIQHFLARRGRQLVGRISAIIDRNYNDFQSEKTGFFGFFESIDDKEVARALFAAAEAWVRARGMNRIMGPTNPGTNHVLALLVEGFDSPPVLQMPYNPRYYIELFGACGLAKARDLYAYYMEDITPISDKIKRVSDLIRKRKNVTVRKLNMKKRVEELEVVKLAYNDAWERNWGFVPWTDEELDHLWDDLKMAADPEMIFFAYVDDELAGFSLSLPDLNQALRRINGRLFPFGLLKLLWYSRKIDMIRVLALGVRKKFQNMGLDAVLLYETYSRGTKQGFHRGEFSWILENNLPMRNALENWGARIYKTYRLFDRKL